MAFSPERAEAIIRAIGERVPSLGRRECPTCEHTALTLASGCVNIEVSSGAARNNMIAPTPFGVLPSVALICRHCGVTFLFNLVMLGLVDGASEEPKGEE